MARDLPIDREAVETAQRALLSARSEADARRVLEALCDPTRLKIVRALCETPLAAGDIARIIGRSQAATSQHLKVLREAEAVTTERKGNVVRYHLAESLTAEVLEDIARAFDQLEPGAA